MLVRELFIRQWLTVPIDLPHMPSKSRLARDPRSLVVYQGLPALLVLLSLVTTWSFWSTTAPGLPNYLGHSSQRSQTVPINAQEIISRCLSLKSIPGPPQDFYSREVSDRYEPGTKATLIKNAVIFTGEKRGSVVIHGSIFLEKGIIKHIGKVPPRLLQTDPNIDVVDAKGAWVTPGLGAASSCSLHFLGADYLAQWTFTPTWAF